MVIMASGIARGRVCTMMAAATDAATTMSDQPEELLNDEENNIATGLVSFSGIFWDVRKLLQRRLD